MSNDEAPAPETAGPGGDGRGLLFIVSAPSGTGKTTLAQQVVRVTPNLRISRSYTSRAPRHGEQDGVDYNFVSRERFEAMREAGGFLEWAEVFGCLYGTAAADTDEALATGCDLLLVIDVQGARKLRRRGVKAICVFVMPPSYAVLEQRLRGRSKDSDEQIGRRLKTARQEVTAYTDYDYVVVNDDVEAAAARLHGIVLAERARLDVMQAEARRIAGTFSER